MTDSTVQVGRFALTTATYMVPILLTRKFYQNYIYNE